MATCPRPDKVAHRSKAKARAAIRSLNNAGKGHPDMSVYRCVCKAWHIGHDPAKLAKRAAASRGPWSRGRSRR